MEQISNEALWGKLTELDKKLAKIQEYQLANQPTSQQADQSVSRLASEPILEKLEQIGQSIIKPVTQKHQHAIEIKSSKVVIVLVSLFLLSLTAILLNISQYRENSRLVDNDLKYRFIKAANQADSIKISELENVFEINRDQEAIKIIRKRVEDYELAVVKRAKILEQARWKEEEAQRLTREAEELKK